MKDIKLFFKYVIPSVLALALSGVYAIVDGFFVGNSVGDIGLSAINVAYPITALIQAIGTGIGIGGAVYYSIKKAEGNIEEAKEYVAGSIWMLVISSIVLTVLFFVCANPFIKLLGGSGQLLFLAEKYVKVISIGAALQIVATGLVPFIRNNGSSFYAMMAMICGFLSNIILDYLLVWVRQGGIEGAAYATIIGQGITMIIAIIYLLKNKLLSLKIEISKAKNIVKSIIKVGLAPFGLTMTPNISLIIVNRFTVYYGGEQSIAAYACIEYVIWIIYLILQGVGDGSQPLMSKYYGEKSSKNLRDVCKLAYGFGIFLSIISFVIMYIIRGDIGILFGASSAVNDEVSKVMPIFLVSFPFVAINRITTASFYATEKNSFAYISTFIEPILMLIFILILPRLFGGQIMIWWSTVFARIISAIVAVILNRCKAN